MRWLVARGILVLAATVVAGCGVGSDTTAPPPVSPVGSFLGDGFMTVNDQIELVANLGLMVRDDRTVEGAAFTSAPAPEYDVFFSGAVDASNNLQASGRMIGNNGTQDVGSFTLTGSFGNFTDGSTVQGSFTAEGIGSGTWRGFLYTIYPLGCYMGAYAGDRQGTLAVMNFQVDDSVVMIKRDGQDQSDYFADVDILIPPTVPGGDYGLLADDSWYYTGLVITGTVGQLLASGNWQQPEDATILTGTWSATKPESSGAMTRGLPAGPLRLHRMRK